VSDLYIVDRLFKVIRERRDVVQEAVTKGPVSDFSAFRHLRGKLEVWDEIENELRLLLKNERDRDDE
jgi:hypothetical protein